MLVSVVMPAHNDGRFIGAAVRSVLAQTVTDWELILVDDGSTDDTRSVLAPYLARYPQIVYLRFPTCRGAAAARTEAIARAAGRYVAFLDSDDLWRPEKLERQIAFMERTGAAFSAAAYDCVDETGAPLGLVCTPPAYTDYGRFLRLSNPVGNLTVMYDQERLGKYAVPDIRRRNDFALWLRIARDAPCYGLGEVLGSYRVREVPLRRRLRDGRYHWQLYYEIERLGLGCSLGAMLCWAWVKGTGLGLDRRRDGE